jgi:hypothetical protein
MVERRTEGLMSCAILMLALACEFWLALAYAYTHRQ